MSKSRHRLTAKTRRVRALRFPRTPRLPRLSSDKRKHSLAPPCRPFPRDTRFSAPTGFKLDKGDEEFARRFEQPLIEALGEETWAQEKAAGATMTLEESIALARSLTERDVTDEAAAAGVSLQQVE